MPVKRQVITGPDIDRLADGIHGPRVTELLLQVSQLQGENRALKRDAKALRKDLRKAANVEATLRDGLAKHREARTKLVRENADLKTRLSAHTPQEES